MTSLSLLQNNLNCAKNKFHRYLPPSGLCVITEFCVSQFFFTFHILFLQSGNFFAMSVYGPVTYQPAPVNIFPTSSTNRGEDDSKIESYNSVHGQELAHAQDYKPVGEYLAAHGSLMPVDPDRIVLKRIVLTGYPVKVKNRTATVKYMFFDVSLLLASSRLCSKRRLTCFCFHFIFR